MYNFNYFKRRGGRVVQWCWLKLLVLGHATNLDNSRPLACCAGSGHGWGLFGHFFLSSVISLFVWEMA